MGWLKVVRLTFGFTRDKSYGAKRSRHSCVVRSMHDQQCNGTSTCQVCVEWYVLTCPMLRVIATPKAMCMYTLSMSVLFSPCLRYPWMTRVSFAPDHIPQPKEIVSIEPHTKTPPCFKNKDACSLQCSRGRLPHWKRLLSNHTQCSISYQRRYGIRTLKQN